MLLLRDLLLWLMISFHVVGAAAVWRRFFPGESPWFGFLLPGLALVFVLNFVEHFLALPFLLWLLPATTLGLIYLLRTKGIFWPDFGLPTAVFLSAFAFTYFVRCMNPGILSTSDGTMDFGVICSYCHGDKIPPTDSWLPTLDLKLYYTMQHYAASVVKRLFAVDVGTAYNASHALLSAFTAFCGAGVAYRASGGRGWVALATVFLIEAAFTGSTAYINLFIPNQSTFVANNLGGNLDNPDRGDNPFWYWVGLGSHHVRLELQVSGIWTWRDEYHANAGGHFTTLFSVFAMLELLRRERTNLPWICALLICPLVFLTSVWLVPIDWTICGGGLALALLTARRPASWPIVIYAVAAGLVALWPSLSDLLTAPQTAPVDASIWTAPDEKTPPFEWLIQWWPIVALWIATLCFWKRLPLGVRLIVVLVPLFCLGIEEFTLDHDRYNTVEKMWGCTYGVGLTTFFGVVASRRSLVPRLLTLVIAACALISMYGWLEATVRLAAYDFGILNLQGDGYLLAQPQKRDILASLDQLRGATLLSGHCEYNYTECPAAALFTGNRCYIASFFGEERFGHKIEADRRTLLNNDFYAGKMADPLGFLNANAIAGVIIWPDDHIPDALIASLKTALAPTYLYDDCRENGPDNAGVFLRRPLPVIQR